MTDPTAPSNRPPAPATAPTIGPPPSPPSPPAPPPAPSSPPPPPSPPRQGEPESVDYPAPRWQWHPPSVPTLAARQLAALVAAAVLANFALRAGVAVLASTLSALLILGALGSRFRLRPLSLTFAAGVALFSIWLSVRASPWLLGLNAVAVVACLAGAASTVQPLPLRFGTRTITALIGRSLGSLYFVQVLSQFVAPLRRVSTSPLVPLIRGLALAVIPVTVLAALLASADAVFASSFTVDLDFTPGAWLGHVFLTFLALAALAGLAAMTGSQPGDESEDWRPLGSTEGLVMLASVGLLYGMFAVVQLLSALGRTSHILESQGVSYAEYARSGFFQLLWVAALTVVLLVGVRTFAVDGPGDRLVRIAGGIVALLTTLIVASAIVRLGLYTEAFGQTTLRWYCTAFAWMLGAAFVMIAAGHSERLEHVLLRGLVALAAATLLLVNVVNPEARVAEHNLQRTDSTVELDAYFLLELSADAWPTLLEHQADIEAHLAPVGRESPSAFFGERCRAATKSNGYRALGFNLARSQVSCPTVP